MLRQARSACLRTWAGSERGGLVETGGGTVKAPAPVRGRRPGGSYRARRPAAFSPRCSRRSSTIRWCTSCSMLVHAAVASCWVVGSSTAAATPPSLSARRDSDRASRSSAVTAFAEGGSGRSRSLSVMPSIVLCVRHKLPTTNRASGHSYCRRRIRQRRRDLARLSSAHHMCCDHERLSPWARYSGGGRTRRSDRWWCARPRDGRGCACSRGSPTERGGLSSWRKKKPGCSPSLSTWVEALAP